MINLNKLSKSNPGLYRWGCFLSFFREQINEPTDAHLTSRCWLRTDLLKAISEIRKKNKGVLKSSFHTSKDILERLEELGWVRKIKTEVDKLSASQEMDFFLVDMEATPSDRPFACELLQATKPNGVISFLSAISLHSLTTQRIPHHHISTLREVQHNPFTAEISKKSAPITRRKRNPLGTYVFSYEGAGFYTSTRIQKKVAGIKKKIVNARTLLRFTDLEQTLLDTFSHPTQCGGLAIINEAWENGLEIFSQGRLAEHLKYIDDKNLTRRTAVMLEMLDVKISDPELSDIISNTKKELDASATSEVIPLFKGHPYSELNCTWGVGMP